MDSLLPGKAGLAHNQILSAWQGLTEGLGFMGFYFLGKKYYKWPAYAIPTHYQVYKVLLLPAIATKIVLMFCGIPASPAWEKLLLPTTFYGQCVRL